MTTVAEVIIDGAPVPRRLAAWKFLRRHPTMIAGLVILGLMIAMAVFAPVLGTSDPRALAVIRRLKWPSSAYWFGTDAMGRDVYSRTLYGARISLGVGLSVAVLGTVIGLAFGLVTGFVRLADAILMRVMDGL